MLGNLFDDRRSSFVTTCRSPPVPDDCSYFNRGVESFCDGAYDAALVQFKAAYATAPNYRVFYNIGQTSLKLQEFASALAAFERYLAEAGADLPPERRSAVEQDVERLNRRVSRVSIVTNVASGEVLVDDASVGRLPLTESVRVSAGRRKIAVVPDGAASIVRVVAQRREIHNSPPQMAADGRRWPQIGALGSEPVGAMRPRSGAMNPPCARLRIQSHMKNMAQRTGRFRATRISLCRFRAVCWWRLGDSA